MNSGESSIEKIRMYSPHSVLMKVTVKMTERADADQHFGRRDLGDHSAGQQGDPQEHNAYGSVAHGGLHGVGVFGRDASMAWMIGIRALNW